MSEEINQTFEDWYGEIIGYGLRCEWFHTDLGYLDADGRTKLKAWLEAAFAAGFEAGIDYIHDAHDLPGGEA